MAEQIRCGNLNLPYHFKKCINQRVPGGEDGEEAGGEQEQAGGSPVLPGVALFGLDCLWYVRAHTHSHAAPLCLPASLLALNSF